MLRFMTLTFIALTWAFYEASGGSAFTPPEAIEAPRLTHAPAPVAPGATDRAVAVAAWGDRDLPEGVRLVAAPSDFAAPGDEERAVVARGVAFDANPLAAPPPSTLRGTFTDVVTGEALAGGDVRVVRASGANMRLGPGTGHEVIGVLDRGEAAQVLLQEGGWARIRARGRVGWTAASLLSPPA